MLQIMSCCMNFHASLCRAATVTNSIQKTKHNEFQKQWHVHADKHAHHMVQLTGKSP